MDYKKKRGMSEIIIAILLVLLVIASIAGVFIWNKTLFSSLTSGSNECSELSFVIGDFCYEEQMTQNIETGLLESQNKLKFNVRNEMENRDIEGFSIFINDNYGNTQTITNMDNAPLVSFGVGSLTTDFFSKANGITEVEIIPKIKLDTKIISCNDKKIIIKWATIAQC
jgi:hypothetical protein